MKKIKLFFLKPAVKAFTLGVLAFANSVLCNFAVGSGIWWKWMPLSAVAIVNVIALTRYSKNEEDLLEERNQLKVEADNMEQSLLSYSTSLQGITEICKFCAKNANVQIHEIVENSRLDCKTWNFDVACDSICKAIYQNILENLDITLTSGGIVDIEVAYVKLVEVGNKQGNQVDRISLSGYYHPTLNGPKILGKIRSIEDSGYRDAQLFYKGVDTPDIQMNPTEIESVFKNNDKKNYSQYIGVPVFCSTSENTSKMVGLLEIVCRGESVLSTDRGTIESLVNHILTPYAYLFLLMFKMDKALRAVPKEGRK